MKLCRVEVFQLTMVSEMQATYTTVSWLKLCELVRYDGAGMLECVCVCVCVCVCLCMCVYHSLLFINNY